MKIFTFFFLWIILSSCAYTKAPAQYKEETLIELNKETNRDIGESMVTYQRGYFSKAIVITKGATALKDHSTRKIDVGEVFVHGSSRGKMEYYFPVPITTYGIALDRETNVAKLYIVDGMGWNARNFDEPIKYEITERPDKAYDSFRQEFIYNGKSNNTLKFTYREFSNDFARPAYSQDLQYDLNESSEIGVKGMRLTVLRATNTNIFYTVKNGFKS